ncbi:MAG: glycosyltransferase [Planctomycetota bacterium]
MKVSHFNTFPYGGAATAAGRIHKQLIEAGHESTFFYHQSDRDAPPAGSYAPAPWQDDTTPKNVVSQFFSKRRVRNIHRLHDFHLVDKPDQFELFSMAEQVESTKLDFGFETHQVIHLHWLAFMADYASFFASIPRNCPVVWTLHDMNPMTGGCHYSDGCKKFQTQCGHCPQVANRGHFDISRHQFNVKKNALKNLQLTVVAPSQWIMRLAQSSPVFPSSTTFQHIRLGFDLKALTPIPKPKAKIQSGITHDKVTIGFGADDVNIRRKGVDLLLSALEQLPDKNRVECIVFGKGDIRSKTRDLPPIREFGYLQNDNQLAQFYSACDLMIVPSREDNQPQTGLEAMACGTPVVGFNVGGIGEYIRPGETGWLAQPEDPTDLAIQIQKLIENEEARHVMGRRCRQMMVQEFDITKQTQKHIELYSRLLPLQKRVA